MIKYIRYIRNKDSNYKPTILIKLNLFDGQIKASFFYDYYIQKAGGDQS